ncbi:hypothetical protein IFM89_030301 [Coptis chinensis]|uniref:Uncharacterized protein n=1 Tax=Coptis chinensis TaxID=261450 RepID=A0A835IRW0_9MAGN|nr:hypothetical protein IFM89_030301 [Coptis chinensis]
MSKVTCSRLGANTFFAFKKKNGFLPFERQNIPSRSHPLTLDVEEQLCRLKSSGATSSSFSLTCHNLSGLSTLYDSMEHLLQSSLAQQKISSERSNTCINEVVDGSLRLLEICNTARDAFSQTKECVRDLQSSLRRKDEIGLVTEVQLFKYIGSLERR